MPPVDVPATMRQLRSLVREDATLRLSLDEVPTPEPAEHEVLIRIDGAPIAPSDLALLLAFGDGSGAESSGTSDAPVTTIPLSRGVMAAVAGRVGESMPVGNEGCGLVVAAGSSPEAQALVGRRVSFAGGDAFADFRALPAKLCLPLPDDSAPAEGAASFVNPMTALLMIETMREEGHTALVHTAAASALGQMLIRLCQAESIPLVNVVRRSEQADLLRAMGAQHVVVSSDDSFTADLHAAVAVTGATLGFDAIGGGRLASQILSAMEAAASAGTPYSRYGTEVHKQVYIYGGLDRSPTELVRTFGLTWGLGGWLLMPRMARLGGEGIVRLRTKVATELTTTFATSYAREITLAEALDPATIAGYAALGTGGKYLIRPDVG
jgi:NADPH2:quinone reductase